MTTLTGYGYKIGGYFGKTYWQVFLTQTKCWSMIKANIVLEWYDRVLSLCQR